MTDETQRQWDEILHLSNPGILFGTRMLDWKRIIDFGVFARKFNDLWSLVDRLDRHAEEVVICAAIMTMDGRIARGHRHPHCFAVLEGWKAGGSYDRVKADETQGFITSRNRFVGRKEGRAIQLAAGIPSADPTRNGEYHALGLFSEDLY